MGYSINSLTQDCYGNTTCLINKFNIKEEEKLKAVESAITFAKTSELEQNPLNGNFDFEHYKSIHRFLFEDLYDWAGKIRTVNISKKGTVFTDYRKIEDTAERCFKRLKDLDYLRTMNFNNFIDNLVDFYCATNILHPFREGNGRTQRIFISQLIRFNGYDINFSNIDPDELMISTIQAANGVQDNLISLFKNSVVAP